MTDSTAQQSDKPGLNLKSITLIGFKSFVDATTVTLPSNLVGVVGPNGCGKSNIIDAVLWVMGGVSPKNLRAESSTDVIFNGSTERKPLGQASVELIFNNPDGAIGGEYAKYSEISIKRVITRDAQSTYYLNNSRCRRKDIIDIFLGTGLGSNSYAIISQGKIGSIIEAKPDDMRLQIEEVAGTSKYKERRRETENRIRHTRDNLDRLNDLREELDKQLDRLKRQSESAEKYKLYKAQERSLKGQLIALRWQSLSKQVELLAQQIREAEIQLEQEITKQRSADTQIERVRDAQVEANEIHNETQARFYQVGGQIGRLEQTISHHQERAKQLQDDLNQLEAQSQQLLSVKVEDEEKLQTIEAQLTELEPQVEMLSAQEEEHNARLAQAEENMQAWQQTWDAFTELAAKSSEQAQVEQTRLRHLEQTMGQCKTRIEKLQEEQQRLGLQQNTQELSLLQAQVEEFSQLQKDSQEKLSFLRTDSAQTRDLQQETQKQVSDLNGDIQKLQGRQASLEALQQAALGNNDKEITHWLEKHSLEGSKRLAQFINVQSDWQLAAEVVLAEQLQAIVVPKLADVMQAVSALQEGEFSFIEEQTCLPAHQNHSLEKLSDKIQSRYALPSLLNTVYTAKNLQDALNHLSSLSAQESIITQDGIWLGQGWIKICRGKSHTKGVLQREQELKDLQTELELKTNLLFEKQSLLEELSQKFAQLEESLHQLQTALQQQSQQLARKESEYNIKCARQEQIEQRLKQIQTEIEEQNGQSVKAHEEILQARHLWQEALRNMETDVDERTRLTEQKDNYRHQLETSRQQYRDSRDKLHQLQMQLKSLQNEKNYKKDNIARCEQQSAQFAERRQSLSQHLIQAEEPIESFQAQLEELLEKQLMVEEELQSTKQRVDNLSFELRELENLRHDTEEQCEILRNGLEKLRVNSQEGRVRTNTYLEQLQELEQNLDEILQSMPEEANETQWDQDLTTVQQRITRLGSINLAAIEEYETESQRKIYLDKQNEDLMEALQILENAIEKIDKETRNRFFETFEAVNKNFQLLFPKIFGGGSACLELTGDDLLDTGVSIMARPPGKKNSTIHLLSGGEKALTAIALVFSFFQLNPAPFCMLDEVDAPLDEANVGRYSNLIKEMSAQVQFIFISHNKNTIAVAEQLAGVTMKEPGVSRLVSVDVQEAIALAEA